MHYYDQFCWRYAPALAALLLYWLLFLEAFQPAGNWDKPLCCFQHLYSFKQSSLPRSGQSSLYAWLTGKGTMQPGSSQSFGAASQLSPSVFSEKKIQPIHWHLHLVILKPKSPHDSAGY